MISPHAIIDPQAVIANDVEIGPWTYIGPEVEIGAGTVIAAHVVIKGPTKIGSENRFFQFSSIGEDAQDKKHKKNEKTFLEIGNRNVFREFVTINRGVMQAGGMTKIGNDNLLMAYVHIAHDCTIGNNTVFANHSTLAGHVNVGDFATLSGVAGVNQFCEIGEHSFIGAGTKVTKDVLPYVLIDGRVAEACGLNLVGLKRRGFSAETLNQLRRAYKIIYRSDLTVVQALEQLLAMPEPTTELKILINALQNSKRGIVR